MTGKGAGRIQEARKERERSQKEAESDMLRKDKGRI